MVSASGDYAVHFGDPDKLVEWECIEQVVSASRVFCEGVGTIVVFYSDYFVTRFHPVRFVSILPEQVSSVVPVFDS